MCTQEKLTRFDICSLMTATPACPRPEGLGPILPERIDGLTLR